jgi:hypothetical protein
MRDRCLSMYVMVVFQSNEAEVTDSATALCRTSAYSYYRRLTINFCLRKLTSTQRVVLLLFYSFTERMYTTAICVVVLVTSLTLCK